MDPFTRSHGKSLTVQGTYGPSMNAFRSVSVKLWTSKYLNASVTRMGTGTRMRTRTRTTELSRIALCTSCSRTENKKSFGSVFLFLESNCIYRKRNVVDYKNRDFRLKYHHLHQN